MQRLTSNWIYGSGLSGLILLALTPLLMFHASAPLIATFLILPAYMIHQYEEHNHDRFRIFSNKTIGKGKEVLTPLTLFIINVPLVWSLIVFSLYGALYLNLDYALIPTYLILVNALLHIVHALIIWCYNPGLFTAIIVFLPLGTFTLYEINKTGDVTIISNIISLGIVILLHAAILFYIFYKLRMIHKQEGGMV